MPNVTMNLPRTNEAVRYAVPVGLESNQLFHNLFRIELFSLVND